MKAAFIPICALLAAAGVCAQTPEGASHESPLEEVVVSGEFPGPGMWRVTRPADPKGHVLWIVADPPPLPARMKWKSRDVETVALSAQEILLDTAVSMEPDQKIGMLRGLTLLPAMLKARRNPGEADLEDLLPADLHARWLVQKRLYLGRAAGVEGWRPLFAAGRLRKAAFEDLKLREGGVVWEVIGKLARKHQIRINSPKMRFTFKRADVRAKLKEFSRESLADVDCFRTTLELTEALADRDTQNARARAWATGDHEALLRLPPLPSPNLSCAMAVLNSQVARDVMPADIREQVITMWLNAAHKSLADNQSTFAIVPFVKLTRPDGYLARLRAQGLLIEEPN
jgi:hypothetical protein